MHRFCRALLVLACLSAVGCASLPENSRHDPRDPLERFNRASYIFTDKVDRAVLKPVARGYRKVTPDPVERRVSNFFDNLGYPTTLVNNLLQAKFGAALNDTGRLLLNTTVGIGGLFDPASAAGLDRNEEDFGQTLGKWGVRSGAFLFIPLLGPSTVRDAFGRIPDEYTNGRHYIERDRIRYTLAALDVVDTRARLLDTEKALEGVYDRYAFIRNAYLQQREYLVTDGQVSEEDLLKEYEDEDMEEPEESAPPPDEPPQ